MMVAVCMTALLVSVGAAVDVAAIQKEKSTLQAITDSAALAAATSRSEKIGELKKIAKAAAEANNFSGLDFKLNLSLEGEIIKVTAESVYNTQLMNIVGIDDLDVGAVTEAPLPKEAPLNISLVLDTTGSMDGPNMEALKSASKKLLEVFDAADPGVIQAGVVPYSKWVNVGLSNRNRSWMDVQDDDSYVDNRCHMTKDLVNPDLCTMEDYTSTCRNDSGTYDCSGTRNVCPDEAYGTEYEVCQDYDITVAWHGCVTSREDPYQFQPEYRGKRFVGAMNVTCGSEILDLTSNLNDVGTHIDNLTAAGNTYIPAGLVWGWRLLDASEPFGGLSNQDEKRKRALVLMTDGSNTVYNDVNSNHADAVRPEEVEKANDYTTRLCTEIKDADIDVYTVAYRLGTGDPAATEMIRNCATSPSYSFQADDAADLEQAFEEIAQSLFEVYISK